MSEQPSQSALQKELLQVRARIDALAGDPDAARLPFTRLAAPVMRALRWEPEVRTVELSALVERLRQNEGELRQLGASDLSKQLRSAAAELSDNVLSLERAHIVRGRVPAAHVGWLERMWDVLLLVERAQHGEPASWLKRRIEVLERRSLVPPLLAAGEQEAVVVGAIDPLIEAAESEQDQLGRRRRLLEAARALLLDASAALNLGREGVAARQRYLSRSIIQLDRYEAAGLDPRIGLRYQLQQAKERGDVSRMHAALSALDEFSLCSGDERLGALTDRALSQLWRDRDRFATDAHADSLARSGAETFDPRVHQAIATGYERALESVPELRAEAVAGKLKKSHVDWAERYLAQENLQLTLQAALSVDGCFDVGGVLSPVRVIEERRIPRLVNYPTQHLILTSAEGPQDLPHAIIEDPRTVMLALAAGNLQARRYVAEEVTRRQRTVLQGEVRIYVLDGSSSMLGPRARMRDAILVAELSTLLSRLADMQRTVRPTLFYRYFTQTLDAPNRVRTEAQALAAISEALSKVRMGGTDIEQALLASFELVRAARSDDPDLARAQIVLVTDGEAPVDLEKVQAARERVGELPIGVSIVALGEENPALKALAAQQRARGERVFYQFIPDAEIVNFVNGTALGTPVHLPVEARSSDLAEAVSQLVDEIAADGRNTEVEALARSREEGAALAELSLERDVSQAECAKAEACARDIRALERRFERWFAAILAQSEPSVHQPPADDRMDLELLVTLLGSVSEVADLLGGDRLSRMTDAIEVFERLLIDSGMKTAHYFELRRRYPNELRPALAAVRSSVLGASA
jgi:hypothetical protein